MDKKLYPQQLCRWYRTGRSYCCIRWLSCQPEGSPQAGEMGTSWGSTKGWVVALVRNSPRHQYILGGIRKQLLKKELRSPGGHQGGHEPAQEATASRLSKVIFPFYSVLLRHICSIVSSAGFPSWENCSALAWSRKGSEDILMIHINTC